MFSGGSILIIRRRRITNGTYSLDESLEASALRFFAGVEEPLTSPFSCKQYAAIDDNVPDGDRRTFFNNNTAREIQRIKSAGPTNNPLFQTRLIAVSCSKHETQITSRTSLTGNLVPFSTG